MPSRRPDTRVSAASAIALPTDGLEQPGPPLDNDRVHDEIRRILRGHADLIVEVATLSDEDDLFRAGLVSHAMVDVMLALEDQFGVEFPERMLRRSVFQSIDAIAAALTELCTQASAGR
jgi:acyl carrier protein